MPLYVYHCPTCDILIERRTSAATVDHLPVECPLCHDLCVRAITAAAIHRARPVALPPMPAAAAHPPPCTCCGARARRS